MPVMFMMHTVQLTYFRFSTQKFSMVGSYTEDLKKLLKTVKIGGWALVQGWVLAQTIRYIFWWLLYLMRTTNTSWLSGATLLIEGLYLWLHLGLGLVAKIQPHYYPVIKQQTS